MLDELNFKIMIIIKFCTEYIIIYINFLMKTRILVSLILVLQYTILKSKLLYVIEFFRHGARNPVKNYLGFDKYSDD
jgi:hypothetical protein